MVLITDVKRCRAAAGNASAASLRATSNANNAAVARTLTSLENPLETRGSSCEKPSSSLKLGIGDDMVDQMRAVPESVGVRLPRGLKGLRMRYDHGN